jgi:DegV family protein with EDD domain
MAGIKIVTDSGSDIPESLRIEHGIVEVPLDVRLGPELLRGISAEAFWAKARESSAMAETSAPSPGAFAEVFAKAKSDGYDGVCCLTISSGLSATFQAARAGAQELSGEIPVEVIDTRLATMGEGLVVLEAAEAAQAGGALEEVAARARQAIGATTVFGTLENLEALRRGGRIGSAQAFIGSMLSIKPIIEVRDGVVEGESRQRTRARSLQYLLDKTARQLPVKRAAVMHAGASDFDEFLQRFRQLDLGVEPITGFIGPTIGAHTGIGTIGVCLQGPT